MDNGICIRAIPSKSDTVVNGFLLSDDSRSEFQRMMEGYEGRGVSSVCWRSGGCFLFQRQENAFGGLPERGSQAGQYRFSDRRDLHHSHRNTADSVLYTPSKARFQNRLFQPRPFRRILDESNFYGSVATVDPQHNRVLRAERDARDGREERRQEHVLPWPAQRAAEPQPQGGAAGPGRGPGRVHHRGHVLAHAGDGAAAAYLLRAALGGFRAAVRAVRTGYN